MTPESFRRHPELVPSSEPATSDNLKSLVYTVDGILPQEVLDDATVSEHEFGPFNDQTTLTVVRKRLYIGEKRENSLDMIMRTARPDIGRGVSEIDRWTISADGNQFSGERIWRYVSREGLLKSFSVQEIIQSKALQIQMGLHVITNGECKAMIEKVKKIPIF